MGKNITETFPAGVLYGEQVKELFDYAKANNFAIPAMNAIGSNSINAALECAKNAQAPIIVQFSSSGAQFFAGKGLPNDNWEASALGAISAARHIHSVAKAYNIPVIIHTDHADRSKLPWIDLLLEASKENIKVHGVPLFSSHMLDLSEESMEENIKTVKEYYKVMKELGIAIEFEIGITGGEEDGVDNTDKEAERLYTKPEEVAYSYTELKTIGDNFSIAAAFGNVHGVYKPGNVELKPEILDASQKYIEEKYNTGSKPVNFVFHGGSGSDPEKIKEAISYGAVKFNIDTDTQWAFWDGVRGYEKDKHDYLQGQIGNPEGDNKPNKKIYDPREWLRAGEKSIIARLERAYKELNFQN